MSILDTIDPPPIADPERMERQKSWDRAVGDLALEGIELDESGQRMGAALVDGSITYEQALNLYILSMAPDQQWDR